MRELSPRVAPLRHVVQAAQHLTPAAAARFAVGVSPPPPLPVDAELVVVALTVGFVALARTGFRRTG